MFVSLKFGLCWCLCWFFVRGKHCSFAEKYYWVYIYSKVCSSSLLNCTHITRLCLDESTAFRPVTSSRSRTPYANTSVFSFMIPCMKYSGAIYLKIGCKVQVKTTTKILYLTMKAWSRFKRQPVSPECAFNGIHNMMGQFIREPLCKPKIWYLYKEGAKL